MGCPWRRRRAGRPAPRAGSVGRLPRCGFDVESLSTLEWKAIHNFVGRPRFELYRPLQDPGEQQDIAGASPQIEHQPGRAFDVQSIVLDISLLQASLSFAPTSLQDGLQMTWRSVAGAEHGRRLLPAAGISTAP